MGMIFEFDMALFLITALIIVLEFCVDSRRQTKIRKAFSEALRRFVVKQQLNAYHNIIHQS